MGRTGQKVLDQQRHILGPAPQRRNLDRHPVQPGIKILPKATGGHFGPQAARALAERLKHPERPVDDPYGSLTGREREVLHLMAEGLTTKEVARRLDIGVKTAENHRGRVLAKLGLRNTAEVVRYAIAKGLLD